MPRRCGASWHRPTPIGIPSFSAPRRSRLPRGRMRRWTGLPKRQRPTRYGLCWPLFATTRIGCGKLLRSTVGLTLHTASTRGSSARRGSPAPPRTRGRQRSGARGGSAGLRRTGVGVRRQSWPCHVQAFGRPAGDRSSASRDRAAAAGERYPMQGTSSEQLSAAGGNRADPWPG
jgi:hypothetical protein